MSPDDRSDDPLYDQHYRLMIESIADYAIYMLDPTGIVRSWNPGAQRSKGYQAAEVIGQHFSLFYTAEDQEAGMPDLALQTALSAGKFEGEGWRVRKDGRRYWAHVVIDPIREVAGKPVGFAKITRDLSERKLFEDSLSRSEEQFRLLVQGVTDYALYMIDPQGRVTNWNTGAERIKGYTADEIIGEHVSRFYTEEDRAAGEPDRALEIAAREGRFETEARLVRRDDSQFRAGVVMNAIRSQSGELAGFAMITRDITDAKPPRDAVEDAGTLQRLSETAERNAARFRQVVEATPAAILMVDADGRIVLVNVLAEELFGYPRSELLGSPVEMLLPTPLSGRDAALPGSVFAAPTAHRRGEGAALFCLKKDGSTVEVEIRISPLETDEGKMVLATITG